MTNKKVMVTQKQAGEFLTFKELRNCQTDSSYNKRLSTIYILQGSYPMHESRFPDFSLTDKEKHPLFPKPQFHILTKIGKEDEAH